jgi:hypothetical protein
MGGSYILGRTASVQFNVSHQKSDDCGISAALYQITVASRFRGAAVVTVADRNASRAARLVRLQRNGTSDAR